MLFVPSPGWKVSSLSNWAETHRQHWKQTLISSSIEGCNANMKEHNCWIQLIALMRTCPWGLWQTNSSYFIALCLNFPLSFQLDTAHCWIMPGEGSYLCNCGGKEKISGKMSTQWKLENTGRVASQLPPLREVLGKPAHQSPAVRVSLPLGKPFFLQGL